MSQDLSSPVTLSAPRGAATPAPARRAKAHTGLTPRGARRIAWLSALIAVVAYGWGIGGNAAHYVYAAAVRTMAANWHNFFYAAYDPAGFISIDKAPGGLWLQALSVRVFGYQTWAMLLPDVLAGGASVLVLFAVVRRWAGHTPAALASVLLAVTPIVVAATRVNLPDAVLVLLLITAAYTFWRALETGSAKWLVLTAVVVGLGFHVKLAAALAVLPVFALVYFACAPGTPGKRLFTLLATGVLTAAASSIWLVAVALTPASSRPYIDGSTTNSVWQMVWNYNLFDRAGAAATSNSADLPVLPDGQAIPVDQGGKAGPLRMFNDLVGGQISWLIPLAALLLVVGIATTWRAPRTDRIRAGWLLWGGWLLVYTLALSFSQNIHPYYTVLLAPPIAALTGVGLYFAFTRWTSRGLAWTLPAGLLITGAWAFVLLNRAGDYLPWLRPVVVVATVGAIAAAVLRRTGKRAGGWAVVTGVLSAIALLAGPIAWAAPAFHPPTDPRTALFQNFNPLAGPNPNAMSTGIDLSKLMAGGGAHGAPQGTQLPPAIMFSMMPSDADQQLIAFLRKNNHGERFDLATVGGTGSSPYVRSGLSVMSMGGFGGTTPVPTRDELAAYVHTGQVRYVLFGGFSYDSPTSLARKDWILHNCTRIDPKAYTFNPWMGVTSALFDCNPAA